MAQASLFSGWTPRNVKPDEVVKLMDGDVNPFTNKPFGASYKTILEKRKGLPVYGYMKEFYKIVGTLFSTSLIEMNYSTVSKTPNHRNGRRNRSVSSNFSV
jgi:hypothetical protein